MDLERLKARVLDPAHVVREIFRQGKAGHHVGKDLLDVQAGDDALPSQNLLATLENDASRLLSLDEHLLDGAVELDRPAASRKHFCSASASAQDPPTGTPVPY